MAHSEKCTLLVGKNFGNQTSQSGGQVSLTGLLNWKAGTGQTRPIHSSLKYFKVKTIFYKLTLLSARFNMIIDLNMKEFTLHLIDFLFEWYWFLKCKITWTFLTSNPQISGPTKKILTALNFLLSCITTGYPQPFSWNNIQGTGSLHVWE